MKLLRKLKYYFAFIITLACLSCKVESSVSSPSKNELNHNTIAISNLKISSFYNIDRDLILNIIGSGFEQKDIIQFKNKYNLSTSNFNIIEIKNNEIIIQTNHKITSGYYDIYATRNNTTVSLGQTYINEVINISIPDIEGMTVKGTIHSQGKGIPNVIVSDGEKIAKTDPNGIYYLPSKKANGYIFVSIPSNFEVATDGPNPQFYKKISTNTEIVEIVDFELKPVNNENHVVALLPDMHMANRNNDISQFQTGFANDIKKLEQESISQNKKFYAITLGDQTWDIYWYDKNYGLKEFKDLIKDFKFPIFHAMGNHDNDPYVADDLLAETSYRNVFGPTYYSFNLGKIHYVVLDNNVHINTGASNGVIGDREHKATITANQIKWLKEDLAAISDKSTPLIVIMHIPFYSAPTVDNKYSMRLTNSSDFVSAVAEFSDVKIMSGHTHYNFRVAPKNSNITEYNIAAVSATWWWTGKNGYANNHTSKDGSPGGYGILDNSGTLQKFYYKSIGFDKNYQFRSYDLNTVHITADEYTPNASATYKSKVATYAGEYATKRTNNEILINVWGYNPNWKITVKENNKFLDVKRVSKYDPLHIISYSMKRLNANADPTSSFVSSNVTHMFTAKASSPTSTVEITVEDEYGNVFTESMTRPKTFSTLIR